MATNADTRETLREIASLLVAEGDSAVAAEVLAQIDNTLPGQCALVGTGYSDERIRLAGLTVTLGEAAVDVLPRLTPSTRRAIGAAIAGLMAGARAGAR